MGNLLRFFSAMGAILLGAGLVIIMAAPFLPRQNGLARRQR